MPNLERLRAHAISHSLFPPTRLKAAIGRLGFVQADPIRAPARAQDLILRHRVKGYRAGDLERRYATLDIEEDVLYAYGFLPRPIWQLLHPRNLKGMRKLEKNVLDVVRGFGAMHPRELEAHFGNAAINGVTYLWPHARAIPKPALRMARFLAPFDPLVWDRRRFEHFWGWPYRFEAYTPIARRIRGYYAMPLLWCDSVIGWANARVEGQRLVVDIGYVKKPPEDQDFRLELDAEIARLETFLSLQ